MHAIIGTIATCALYVAWHHLVFARLIVDPIRVRLAASLAGYITASLFVGWLACSIGLVMTLLRAIQRGMQIKEDGDQTSSALKQMLEM